MANVDCRTFTASDCSMEELFEKLLTADLNDEQLSQFHQLLPGVNYWNGRFSVWKVRIWVFILSAFMVAALIFFTLYFSVLMTLLYPDSVTVTQVVETVIFKLADWLPFVEPERNCLVTMTALLPEMVSLDLLRSTSDCNFCQNITSIPRVNKLDQQHFLKKYAYSGVPVVVTDATNGWKASEAFNFEFFRNLYHRPSGTSAASGEDNCQFFPYKTEFLSLAEVFEMPKERAQLNPKYPAWYIGWSNCNQRIAAILRSYYTRPYFLPSNAETLGTDWVFMGSPRYGAHMHVDNVGHPSWQAQVRGRKRWTLKPPLECSYQCSTLSVVIEPGEIIALDTTIWYHSTYILDGDISIAIGAEFD